jgi:hypothetical protein
MSEEQGNQPPFGQLMLMALSVIALAGVSIWIHYGVRGCPCGNVVPESTPAGTSNAEQEGEDEGKGAVEEEVVKERLIVKVSSMHFVFYSYSGVPSF